MARTDIHSPTNLVTEDYEFFGCGNFGTGEIDPFSPLISPEGQRLLKEGYKFADVETAGCQHCGAFLIYYAILLHPKTKSFVRVGETCLDNRFSLATAEFQRLRKGAKLNRDRKRLSDKREEWLNARPDNRAALEYAENSDSNFCAEHKQNIDKCWEHMQYGGMDCKSFEQIFVSIVRKKGEASDRFVASMIRARDRAAERKAKREAERAEGHPCPEGKIDITGTILKIDTKVNDFGSREVMTVKDDNGFKVWGTQSPALYECEVGDRVSFTATVTRSDNDDQFGFFKRPSKAKVI